MLSCFQNLIGVKNGCTPETPSSGLFVNDLPGIDLDIADAALTSEEQDAVQFIKGRIDFATNRLLQDFRTFLQPKFRVNSILETDTLGQFEDNLDLRPLEAGKFKGILIEVDNDNYLSLFLSSVTLFLDAAVTTNVNVINLLTGKIEDTFSITTVADTPTQVILNKEYPIVKQRLQLLICIDSSVANSYKTDIHSIGGIGCRDCNNTGHIVRSNAREISQAASLILNNTVSINDTNGVSLDYSLQCSINPYVCEMADSLAYPLLQRTGAEIMTELKYSKRLNSIITIHASEHDELREEFEEQYQNSMNQILDNLQLSNDWCFKCTPKIMNTVQLP